MYIMIIQCMYNHQHKAHVFWEFNIYILLNICIFSNTRILAIRPSTENYGKAHVIEIPNHDVTKISDVSHMFYVCMYMYICSWP